MFNAESDTWPWAITWNNATTDQLLFDFIGCLTRAFSTYMFVRNCDSFHALDQTQILHISYIIYTLFMVNHVLYGVHFKLIKLFVYYYKMIINI